MDVSDSTSEEEQQQDLVAGQLFESDEELSSEEEEEDEADEEDDGEVNQGEGNVAEDVAEEQAMDEENEESYETSNVEEDSDDDYPSVRQRVCWEFKYSMVDEVLNLDSGHLFNSPSQADMTFLLYDGDLDDRYQKPLFAHSFVLCPASACFRNMYAGRPCYIPINYISYKRFSVLLKLVYCGWDEKAIPLSEVTEYYRIIRHFELTNKFQFQFRTWLMKEVAHFHVDNVASIYTSCFENQFNDILGEVLGEIADYPEKITKDPNFRKIPLRAMTFWLERKFTNANRSKLRRAVRRWIAANRRNPDEEGKRNLLHLVSTVPYRHRGKRLMLQTAPGVALSYVRCDDEYILNWAEQQVDVPLIDEDHEYNIRASFDIMFDETVKIYGLSMVLVPHKNHDPDYDEIDVYGEVEILLACSGNQINWAQFERTINFQEEEYVMVECFFMRTVLEYDERYIIKVHWKSFGPYPDLLTFDTPQSYVKTFGNCFVNSIWFDPMRR